MDELYNQLYEELKYCHKQADEISEEDKEMKSYYEGRADALEMALNYIRIYNHN